MEGATRMGCRVREKIAPNATQYKSPKDPRPLTAQPELPDVDVSVWNGRSEAISLKKLLQHYAKIHREPAGRTWQFSTLQK
jgi:hypothetical protein